MTTMTKDEIMKAYENCASANDCSSCNDCPDCANCASAAALALITEQEKSIQVAQDSILSLAQQNQEYREQQVKQAKIDVLNELKKKTHNYYPSIDSYCVSQHVVLVRDIDELIKEVQNGKDKG